MKFALGIKETAKMSLILAAAGALFSSAALAQKTTTVDDASKNGLNGSGHSTLKGSASQAGVPSSGSGDQSGSPSNANSTTGGVGMSATGSTANSSSLGTNENDEIGGSEETGSDGISSPRVSKTKKNISKSSKRSQVTNRSNQNRKKQGTLTSEPILPSSDEVGTVDSINGTATGTKNGTPVGSGTEANHGT